MAGRYLVTPDLDTEPGDPLEVPCVHRGHPELHGNRSRAYDQVVRSHCLSAGQQVCPQPRVHPGRLQPKLRNREPRQDVFHKAFPLGPVLRCGSSMDSVQQFAGRESTDGDRFVLLSGDVLGQGQAAAFGGDENTGIDQDAYGTPGIGPMTFRPDSRSRAN